MPPRSLLLVALVALVVSLAGCSDDDPDVAPRPTGTPSTPATTSASATPDNAREFAVTFAGGEATGDTEITVARGTRLAIAVTSDVADEVHNHLNDESVDVPAGETVTLRFLADAPGIFEIELEELGEQLVELRITG